MVALWLTLAAGLPLDDLVKHQHGQMMRYWAKDQPLSGDVLHGEGFSRPSRRTSLLATSALTIEDWRQGRHRALVLRPASGPAVCVPLIVEPTPHPVLTTRLRGKSRYEIARRLMTAIGSQPETENALATAICREGDMRPRKPSEVTDPAALPYLRTALDESFAALLTHLRERIETAERDRRARWKLFSASPASASAALRNELRLLAGVDPQPRLPLQPELRPIGETRSFVAYEVLIPTLPDFDAYGHLLIPKNQPGRQAAVIVQHGLGGQPKDLSCMGAAPDKAYHCLGAHLAEQGFVVFAPYVTHPIPQAELINPLAERARAVGRMRISAELIKLHQIVDFLQARPEIDPQRIGYYGLSYGGYSAIWMGPLEPRLAAIVVSGHFNDWREKITNLENPTSYMFHPDEDFYNHDVLHRLTHVELIAAMWPRPVCVEFAEYDATTTPQWHERAWSEVAKIAEAWHANFVRDHFHGVHEIHGVGTIDFLNRYLRPERPAGRDGGDLITQRLQAPVRGSFYGEGAFTGIALRVQRRGEAAPLVVKYGTRPGAADLGTATLASVADGWVEAPVPAQTLVRNKDYFFEISTEPADGAYDLFGPRPLGGQRWERDFAVSFRLLR